MKRLLFPVFALSLFVVFSSCDRKAVVVETVPATPIPEPVAETKTLETSRLGTAIDDFERQPTAEKEAEVKKAMARLDEEIAKLEEYIAKHDGDARAKAAGKLENMQSYRKAEALRFAAAQAKGSVGIKAVDTRTGAEKAEDSAKKVGEGIQEAARKTGETIKDAVH